MHICTRTCKFIFQAMEPDKSWISLPRYDRRYVRGVVDFTKFVEYHANGNEFHYCPCNKCKCRSEDVRYPIAIVKDHLLANGF